MCIFQKIDDSVFWNADVKCIQCNTYCNTCHKVYPVFSPLFQVNMEFMLITTVPLITKFTGQLDRYANDLMRVFCTKGGSAWGRRDIPTPLHCETPPFRNTPTPKHRCSDPPLKTPPFRNQTPLFRNWFSSLHYFLHQTLPSAFTQLIAFYC